MHDSDSFNQVWGKSYLLRVNINTVECDPSVFTWHFCVDLFQSFSARFLWVVTYNTDV